jgi:proteic killer suppression protein
LEVFWKSNDAERVPTDWTRRIKQVLDLLDDAEAPEDMAIPGYRFHAFAEGRRPRFAVMVSQSWRVSFSWQSRSAIDVALEQVD